MTDSHFRNSLRYVCIKRTENLATSTDNTSVAEGKANMRQYYERKIIELGNEAQRRHIIPNGDITVAQLITIASGWPTARDPATRLSPTPAIFQRIGQQQTARVNAPADRIASVVTQAVLAAKHSPITEVEEVIAMRVFGMEESDQTVRRIQMDL